MNFVGHIAVADLYTQTAAVPSRTVRSGTAGSGGPVDRNGPAAGAGSAASVDRDGPGTRREKVLLGAALPDFAAWRRFRLISKRALGTALGDGVALHHRTDTVFHRHQVFTTLQGDVRRDLAADGVSRGAARACAHVGVEILLDGALLDSARFIMAVEVALAAVAQRPAGLGGLTGQDEKRWLRHLDSIADRGVPASYADPQWVAHTLFRILSDRPRLSFPVEQVPAVTRTLQAHHRHITAAAFPLVTQVAEELDQPRAT